MKKVPSRDLVRRSFGRTLHAHSLSLLFHIHHSSRLLGRDGHPTRESSLASRCPGIHPRVAHAPPATPIPPISLPSQSYAFFVLTSVLRIYTYPPGSVRAEVVWPV
ncbi:hypothetical protein RSOLAG1IB_06287 [Rhizoctonia solani AG-1 IB]|uniref:Uncharacterized protein n=1 Tax=Thanatephorus cucumeris (strain AG1-IB / isolate 7/3/14) TaxID=1108050 RepID=A0A0B7F6Z2_THACB|nr:hypothetical protein RSOLAG1IB_06287 [Rhizoctonia solani AG-1 IB]